jgi:hypothetical protein
MADLAELTDDEFNQHVQVKAEAHLAACFDAMEAFDEGDENAESPALAPFDGCPTCTVREVLMVCWDEMYERITAQIVGLPTARRLALVPPEDEPQRSA